MANINKIRISGSTFDIEDKNAAKTVTLTQAEYDALTVKDPNVFYVISDSEYNFDGYWTSAQTQNAITQSVSGKADTSAVTSVSDSLTAHTANTTVHVTAQDKTNWNNKSDFSGNYNDLTNKPTIPTVPTSNTAFTNDAGYITSGEAQTQIDNSISGKADSSAVTQEISAAVSSKADTSYVDSAVSGKVDTSTYTAYTAATDTALASKQTTLTAGTGISIVDNVISATGGGGGLTEDDELLLSTALTDLNDRKIDASEVKSNYQKKGDYVTTNTLNTRLAEYETALDEQNVEEVTAYALNDLNERFGGLKIVKISETVYAALTTKDENTLYIVVADPS